MNKVNSYNLFSNYHQNKVNQKKSKDDVNAAKAGKNKKTDKTGKKTNVPLSERAQKLLEELKQTYSNMDFMVADYDTEAEAQEYLSRGTKEYSVLIDPETLEEMAADEDVKNKYLGILEDAADKFSKVQDQLKENMGGSDSQVVRLGVSIDKNGNVSYFVELEKMSEAQKERIEKAKEKRQEERAEERDRNYGRDRGSYIDRPGQRDNRFIQEGAKRTRVQADSVDGLLAAIQNVDWNQIKGDGGFVNGDRLDLSI